MRWLVGPGGQVADHAAARRDADGCSSRRPVRQSARSLSSTSSRTAAETETMMWVYERADGGRSFGFTGGHTHANWGDPNQRRIVIERAAVDRESAPCPRRASSIASRRLISPSISTRKVRRSRTCAGRCSGSCCSGWSSFRFCSSRTQFNALADRIASGEVSTSLAALAIGGLLALDVFLPVPSSIVSTAAGVLLGLGPGASVVWIGMMAGCLVGYVVGVQSAPLARRLVGPAGLARAADILPNVTACGRWCCAGRSRSSRKPRSCLRGWCARRSDDSCGSRPRRISALPWATQRSARIRCGSTRS